ncbi:hypothetical protein AB1Y20_006184 [Prymnesium parvum]|uniref:Uncharacterized protein n=1 Tax=Prymnesium parvum TaxID=97485 RepID=A0AB34J1J7_PRYPA
MVVMSDSAPEVTPLVAAIKAGDEKALAAAIQDSSPAEKEGDALLLAAKLGQRPIVEALLAASFKTSGSAQAAGWSAAMFAAAAGHVGVVEALLAHEGVGCLAAPEGSSMTPLLLAALKGHTRCAEVILDASPESMAATDAAGRNALHLAATSGSETMIELLVRRGMEIDAVSPDGRTALMWAVAAHQVAAVGALARLGADPSLRDVARPDAPVVPGKVRGQGDDALDIAHSRRDKDPTLRHIAAYLEEWIKSRAAAPDAPAPPMPPLVWVAHAEAWVAAGGDAATPAAEEATGAPATAEQSDIFDGEDDDVVDEEVSEGGVKEDKTEMEQGVSGMKTVEAAAPTPMGDLDELD